MDPPRKQWTRSEYEELEQKGLFDQQRVELVYGDFINKMGKNRPQVNALALMVKWLSQFFDLALVNQDASIDVAPQDNPMSEPQPDLIVLKRPTNQIAVGNPRPQELQLVIEVSDTSLHFDLTRKADLYARAGIAEYWVLDVAGRKLFVHREPQVGKYQLVTEYSAEESVAPLSAPQAQFLVSSAFPPTE